MKLEGKIAVVTGSSRGIGKGIALELAQQGADVIVHYNNSAESAEELVREIKKTGRRTKAVRADMGRIEDVRRLISTAIEEFGGIDILVNNAAVSPKHEFFEITEEDWDEAHNINLKGLFFGSLEAARSMKERGWGRIINIGSVHSMATLPLFTVYSAAKGGVDALTRQMALELGPYGITVNAVAPGLVEVERYADNPHYNRDKWARQLAVGRVGFPKDIAPAVAFIASEECSFMTGEIITIDGGQLATLAIQKRK
jgi:NAD(P)-dependent dehydrogenase (short-subunit alcohol dehydrogenase family)